MNQRQFDRQFKLDAVQYRADHPDISVVACARNLGIGQSTLRHWIRRFGREGDIQVRGSGNFASDDKKEIARLRRQLQNTEDALAILKKAIGILGK